VGYFLALLLRANLDRQGTWLSATGVVNGRVSGSAEASMAEVSEPSLLRFRDVFGNPEHFYHKSQQLGSAHSIFGKTLGGAAAISSAKPPSPKSSAQWTPRWRGQDSNF
jgi:hypothetical protein